MKTIGIIGAMEEEIIFLKSMMEIVSAKNIVGTDFFMGKMHGKNKRSCGKSLSDKDNYRY